MSGHSKWNNIKRKKEKTDTAKAKIFTKIGRELAVAVKEGGGADPSSNFRLRDCILKAKENNVPNENINRIIRKAASEDSGASFERVTYEGYGPGGVAVIVSCLTDNRNRTAGSLRHYFDKCDGNLGEPGCVAYLFEKKGIISLEVPDSYSEDEFVESIIDANIEDYEMKEGENCIILTTEERFESTKKDLLGRGFNLGTSEIKMFPLSCMELEKEKLEKMAKLISFLENDDDVQEIYNNCSNLPDIF